MCSEAVEFYTILRELSSKLFSQVQTYFQVKLIVQQEQKKFVTT